MDKLYELKETLCKQLEEYADRDLTAGTLDVVDKLAHATKNLDKIIEMYESGEYSQNMGGSYGMYDNRNSYRDHSMGMNSYARGRGRNARRDSMGRYSRDGYSRDMMADLHELMESAPDERTRQEFQKFIQKMEQQ